MERLLATRRRRCRLVIDMHAYIEDIGKHEGEEVTIKGWLHNRRSSGKIHFLILRDGTRLHPGRDVEGGGRRRDVQGRRPPVAGNLASSSPARRAPTSARRAATRSTSSSFEVVGESHDYPITPKEHGVDYLLDRRHLWIRSERQQAILRVRHEIINAVRDFFNDRGLHPGRHADLHARRRARARRRCSRSSTSRIRRPT